MAWVDAYTLHSAAFVPQVPLYFSFSFAQIFVYKILTFFRFEKKSESGALLDSHYVHFENWFSHWFHSGIFNLSQEGKKEQEKEDGGECVWGGVGGRES